MFTDVTRASTVLTLSGGVLEPCIGLKLGVSFKDNQFPLFDEV